MPRCKSWYTEHLDKLGLEIDLDEDDDMNEMMALWELVGVNRRTPELHMIKTFVYSAVDADEAKSHALLAYADEIKTMLGKAVADLTFRVKMKHEWFSLEDEGE